LLAFSNYFEYNNLANRRICYEHGFEPDLSFVIRDLMIKNPFTVITTWSFTFFALSAQALRIVERPYYSAIDEISMESFWSAMWLVIITATTIGYGGVYACTPLGRGVTMVVIFVGAVISAILIAIIAEGFEIPADKKSAIVKISNRTQAAVCIKYALQYNYAKKRSYALT